jgi:hypothetical protein
MAKSKSKVKVAVSGELDRVVPAEFGEGEGLGEIELSEEMLSAPEVRHAVKLFHVFQRERIALSHYVRQKGASEGLIRLLGSLYELEKRAIKVAADSVKHEPVYKWLTSVKGVGPSLAAQLMGLAPAEKFPHPGHLFSYAGLTPQKGNRDGQDHRYSRRLKALAYKLAKSQVMVDGDYRPWYERRKMYEWRKNLEGKNAEVALRSAKQYGKDTTAYMWASGRMDPRKVAFWLAGELKLKNPEKPVELVAEGGRGVPMIPPSHVEARTLRWLAKLILDHYWQVAYYYRTGQVWIPYAIAHLGHVERIDPVEAPWLIRPHGFTPNG